MLLYFTVPSPHVTLSDNNDYYNTGERLILTCVSVLDNEFIDVKTITTFIWKYNSTLIQEESVDNTLVTTTYSSNLVIDSLKLSDSGIYSCEVTITSYLLIQIIPSETIELTKNITVIGSVSQCNYIIYLCVMKLEVVCTNPFFNYIFLSYNPVAFSVGLPAVLLLYVT